MRHGVTAIHATALTAIPPPLDASTPIEWSLELCCKASMRLARCIITQAHQPTSPAVARLEFGLEDLVIYGAGGHAKSVIAVIEHQRRWRLAGLIEDGSPDPDRIVLGYPLLGDRTILPQLRRRGLMHAHVAVGENRARARMAALILEAGFELGDVVHPSACVMKGATIGNGAFLHAYSLVGPECVIGDNVIVNTMASVGHESRVGHAVHVAPGVRIGGGTTIGDLCFVGPNAVVHPGVTIGRNVRVAANAVVTRDVESDVVIAGMPAKVVRRD